MAVGILLRALVGHDLERRLVDALGLRQRHAILRALRAGEAGLDRGEIELEHVGVVGGLGAVHAPHALRLGIRLDQRDLLGGTARQLEIAQRLLVDGEDAAGAAVFRRHVGDRGAIGQRQVGEAVAEELDELVDHAFLAQHLGDGEHEIGGGAAGLHRARQLEADDLRNEHR